jgi:predicted dehydrogenase
LGYVKLYAIGEREIEKAKRLAAEFGAVRAEADYHALLEDPEIHAVHVCTPNVHHYPMAKAALLAGKHVICEKPLAMNVAEAEELVKIAKEKGLRNCTAHNLRFYPMVQQMRRMIADGDIGEVQVLQGTYSQDWLLYDTDWNWRLDSKSNGKSRCLADIGSHWCDMAEHITGQRITSVCCDMATFHKTRKMPKGPIETFAGKTLAPDGVPHGQWRSGGIHREPGEHGLQESAGDGSVRDEGRRALESGASRRVVDRESELAESVHHQGSIVAEAGSEEFRRSAGRAQRRVRR